MHRYVKIAKKGVKVYNSHEDSQLKISINAEKIIGCRKYKDCKLILEVDKGHDISIACNSKVMMKKWIKQIKQYYLDGSEQESEHNSIESHELMG